MGYDKTCDSWFWVTAPDGRPPNLPDDATIAAKNNYGEKFGPIRADAINWNRQARMHCQSFAIDPEWLASHSEYVGLGIAMEWSGWLDHNERDGIPKDILPFAMVEYKREDGGRYDARFGQIETWRWNGAGAPPESWDKRVVLYRYQVPIRAVESGWEGHMGSWTEVGGRGVMPDALKANTPVEIMQRLKGGGEVMTRGVADGIDWGSFAAERRSPDVKSILWRTTKHEEDKRTRGKPQRPKLPAEVVIALDDIKAQFEKAYKLMNYFASGKSQEQWSRVEPTAVLAEVYGIMAPCPGLIDQIMAGTSPDAERANLRHALQQEFEQKTNEAINNNRRKSVELDAKARRLEEEYRAKEEARDRIMQLEIADRVEAEVAERMAKLAGKTVTAGKRRISL